MKKFKDLEAGEHIFTIEQSTQNIISYPIKSIKGYGANTILIEYYKVASFMNVQSQTIVDSAKDTGQIDDLPVGKLIVPMHSERIMTVEAVPNIYSASKENLEQWMTKSLKSKR